MIVIVSLLILILSIITWFKVIGKIKPFPKGLRKMPIEKGLPIVGISHQIKGSLHSYLQELAKKHGPLYEINLGMRRVVVLNNYDIISKALKDNSDVFSGRFETTYKKQITRHCGFVFHDGETWEGQRAFLLKVLRDLGVRKSKSIEIINEELEYMLEDLMRIERRTIDIYNFISLFLANIISKFFMNKRFERGSEELRLINKLNKVTIESRDKVDMLCFMFPFFDNSPLLIKMVNFFYPSIPQLYEKIFLNHQMEIDRHLKMLDPNSEGEDFMEIFLRKQQKLKKVSEPDAAFTDWQLIMTVHDILIGGVDTSTTLFHWSCMFLSKFPDVQNKVYLEIVNKVGNERRVTINDKTALSYTMAVMDEIMRMSSISPFSVPHRTLKDSIVNGFFIPKDSLIFTNVYACHYDPEIWKEPMQFKPERFLTTDQERQLKYYHRKELINFSMGKRKCIGESLARLQYFIFFVNTVQNFFISSADEITDKKYEDVIRSEGGLIRGCSVKKFIFKKRSQEGKSNIDFC